MLRFYRQKRNILFLGDGESLLFQPEYGNEKMSTGHSGTCSLTVVLALKNWRNHKFLLYSGLLPTKWKELF